MLRDGRKDLPGMNQKMDERSFVCVCVGGFKRKKVESREGQRVHKKTAHGKRMKYIGAY